MREIPLAPKPEDQKIRAVGHGYLDAEKDPDADLLRKRERLLVVREVEGEPFSVGQRSLDIYVPAQEMVREQSSYRLVREIRLQNLGKRQRDAGVTPKEVAYRPDLIIPSLEEY